jgi:alkylation response protein AidB-like acyl-CoA dehydrogenase
LNLRRNRNRPEILFGVSANCLGMARAAFDISLAITKDRIVAGKPVIEY